MKNNALKKTVYIAGPIASRQDTYKEDFAKAEKAGSALGYIVLNPATLPAGMVGEKYMPICLAMVEQVDIVCLLPGWEESPGANLERQFAHYQGKTVTTLEALIGE